MYVVFLSTSSGLNNSLIYFYDNNLFGITKSHKINCSVFTYSKIFKIRLKYRKVKEVQSVKIELWEKFCFNMRSFVIAAYRALITIKKKPTSKQKQNIL